MIRTYKHNGKMWRYEEGEQPAGAVEVKVAPKKPETPEARAAKAPAKRASAGKAKQ